MAAPKTAWTEIARVVTIQNRQVTTHRFRNGRVSAERFQPLLLSYDEYREAVHDITQNFIGLVRQANPGLKSEPIDHGQTDVLRIREEPTGIELVMHAGIGTDTDPLITKHTWDSRADTVLVVRRGPFDLKWGEYLNFIHSTESFIRNISFYKGNQ